MSTYIIGDVQGCFDSLQALLQKINYNPKKDRLGFVGDLVNRGPKSLATLRFASQLKNPLIVLGNHDLHFMALYFLQNHHSFKSISHTLEKILTASDCEKLIYFLLQQPLMIVKNNFTSFSTFLREWPDILFSARKCHPWPVLSLHDSTRFKEEYPAIHPKVENGVNFVMIHAGIPPQWTIEQALCHAKAVEKILRDNPTLFFENIYGNNPAMWHENLSHWDRVRYIVNAFTRMRFCDAHGTLDLENKTTVSVDEKYRPWFEWIHPKKNIYFGHWASLNGQCTNPAIFALDTGCAWGGKLTAIRIEDKKIYCVKACEKN